MKLRRGMQLELARKSADARPGKNARSAARIGAAGIHQAALRGFDRRRHAKSADLAELDPSLYRAYRNWKAYRLRKKQPTEIGFDLPTRQEVTKRLIDRVIGSGICVPRKSPA